MGNTVVVVNVQFLFTLVHLFSLFITCDWQVESILDKEDFTLEELLDEEDIIQECRALNSRLINL